MKKHIILKAKFYKLLQSLAILCISVGISFAQQPPPLPPKPLAEDFTWWYITLFVLIAGLAGAIYWKIKSKKVADVIEKKGGKKDTEFDAEEEMEWLRKNQNIVDRKRKKAPKKKALNLPNTSGVLNGNGSNGEDAENSYSFDDLETIPLPVYSINRIEKSKTFANLPLSNDEALLSAIEQTQDEYEEDEEIRDLAIRILMAFRTRNSIESLSQIAIYDLSSSLRSKAVSVLADFDHESVFETILLGCADPTREVRAAAARGLSRLSFDRTSAWSRIIETNEEGRMRQAARAAIEGGFAERSLDRLVNRDAKYVTEAFVLIALIIKSGEVDLIIEALKSHRDMNVRFAILHIFKVVRDNKVLSHLYHLIELADLPTELKAEIDKTINEMSLVTA